MSKQNECCESCHEASTCTKDVIGWKRFSFEGKPGMELYPTEDAGWDTGNQKYDGSFEVYPICRDTEKDMEIEEGRYMETYGD